MKSVTFTSRHDGEITVKIGTIVGFKSDIEQYGKVTAIKPRGSFYEFTVVNENGFDGGYIGGDRETVVFSDDVWID